MPVRWHSHKVELHARQKAAISRWRQQRNAEAIQAAAAEVLEPAVQSCRHTDRHQEIKQLTRSVAQLACMWAVA